jgi:hypothetical protein
MNKFDCVIKEAGYISSALNLASKGIESAKNIGQIASTFVKSNKLSNFTDLFKKYESKVKLVNHDSALETSKQFTFFGLRDPNIKTNEGNIDAQKTYSKNAIIMDDNSGFSGLVAKTINYENDIAIKSFKELLKNYQNVFDVESFINGTKKNNRFWIIISKKGDLTVDKARQEDEKAEQEVFAATNVENFNLVFNDYYPDFLTEAKKITNLVPFNSVEYDTYFIYKSQYPENVGKFKITLKGQQPQQSYGSMIKMEGNCSGLAQVGNKTLYARWYFLNDFSDLEQQEKDKNEPKSVSLQGKEETQKQVPMTPQTGSSPT